MISTSKVHFAKLMRKIACTMETLAANLHCKEMFCRHQTTAIVCIQNKTDELFPKADSHATGLQ